MKPALRAFLLDPGSYPHPSGGVRHLETHISELFLTGEYVYKVKKDVRLDFLDFSTLERRRHFCRRELELNRRFAPELYLSVVSITDDGSGKLALDGSGEPVEFAVKMREFDGRLLFTELLSRNELTAAHLDALTRKVAAFHRLAENTPERWSAAQVRKAAFENIGTMERHCPDPLDEATIADLGRRTEAELEAKRGLIESRRERFVGAYHGDLHLRNVCIFRGEPLPFDGIEFDDDLACCDRWADIAFLIMDLRYRGRADSAAIVTNVYLEELDDFAGLALLPLYLSYRAAVRGKVNCLEWDGAPDAEARAHAADSARRHAALALDALMPRRPTVTAIGGLSGTGKSTLARELALRTGAVQIRSDAVRKHLAGVPVLETAPAAAYGPEMDERVYRGLIERGETALRAGRSVILDAVHRSSGSRREAEALAARHGARFTGIWCELPLEEALARVRARSGDASDAGETIVREQYRSPVDEVSWLRLDTRRPAPELVEPLARQLIG